MGRILITLCICTFITFYGTSQCPDLPNNVQVNGTNDLSFPLCGSQSVSFTVDDPNLPSGAIDWYSSTTSGLPPTSGTLIGSSTINSADPCQLCPTIEAIYIDACGDEGLNEFVIVGSGSGLAIDDLSFTFDNANTGGSAANGNINVGGICGWSDGDLNLVVGCPTMISVGPGDYVPPNSTLIIQTSSQGTTTYDVSGICSTSECIYVVKNSCDRIIGGFSNCSTSSNNLRTSTLGLTCGCNDVLTYDRLDPAFLAICAVDGNGMHVFSDLTYANNGCNIGPNLASIPQFTFNAVTDPFNHTFTDAECNTEQFIVGVLNSDQYNEDCCSEQITNEYSFSISCAEADLSGGGDLCPGECEEISVIFTGGEAPYVLNLQLTGLPIPLPLPPLPGFEVNDKITICYDTGGPLLDLGSNTVNVPSTFGGISGALELVSFTDDNGCAGTVNNGLASLSFIDAPDIVTPPPFTECDMGDGTAFFILSNFDLIINNGTGLTVNYFSDDMGLFPISNPYQTGTTTIYAQVEDNPCNSEIVPIMLEVISNGDAGIVNMFCNTDGSNSLECTVCDDDNTLGEDVNITIVFEDGSVEYYYVVEMTTGTGVPIEIDGTAIGGSATITQNISETTTFTVTLVDPNNDCPDMTDLGDPVTIFYSVSPDIDNPGDLSDCGSVTLPAISGNMVPTNAGYYSMPGGMGTMFSVRETITSDMTIYLYGGITDCEQEFEIDITIESAGAIDDPGPISACGSYILPAISGTNIDNASYYTETNGGGSILPEGQNITATSTIYIYDAVCGSTEVSFLVTISPGSVITTGPDTISCDTFFLGIIEGMDLTGNESYYELSGGNGQEISVGDTITQDTTIYIYDNTPGCIIEIPYVITISNPQFPGLDSSIVICENDPTLYNINELLAGGTPDENGQWSENGTNIIIDSTSVDFSSLATGAYSFRYEITDTICMDTAANLRVIVVGQVNAGQDTLLAVCETITGVDVYALLGNPDEGGIFVDNTGTPGPFDPNNATFTTDVPGLVVYNYIVGDPLSSCGADTSIFSVITGDEIYAGDDASLTLCAGEVSVLSSVLTNNTALGTYSEPTTSGGLEIIGNFNSTLVSDGEYIIYHILQGSGQCPDDTAVITITVVDGPSAGDEQTLEICGGEIDLEDILDPAADPNGSFYFAGSEITNTLIDFTGISGDQEYLYIVGNGVGCPFDTAILSLTIPIEPIYDLVIDNASICTGDCATISITAGANNNQQMTAYYSISGSDGFIVNRTTIIDMLSSPIDVEFCEGNGDQMNNFLTAGESYTISLDSLDMVDTDCIFYQDITVEVMVLPVSETLIDDTYCFGQVLVVGPDTYMEGNESGQTILQAVNGCDSTVTVDLTFQGAVPGEFITEECEGGDVEVLGILYTSSFSGDTTLTGASAGGCDSIVMIDITFLANESQNYFDLKCDGETEVVGGITFSETNSSGIATIPGGASNGCDLEINVIFTYIDNQEILINDAVCDNYSIDIGDGTYDISNPSGMEILPSSIDGECDTLVMIDLDFSASGVDSMITTSTCDDNFSLVIGSETFDINNQQGEATTNGVNGECDTTFTVDITFGEIFLEIEEVDAGCEVIDSGSVIINLGNGELPYNIIYNGNNTIAFVLPVEIPLPAGQGDLMITDATGCETTISYEILEGNSEEDFSLVANGNQLSIEGGTVDSVFWMPNDSISCIDCLDPIVNPESTTLYSAIVYFGGSCIVTLDYLFEVEDNVPDYIVPSVFSPNRDGTNDNFFLTVTDGAIGIPQSMQIYDRWGNKVFVTAGPEMMQAGWDGTWDGDDVAPGVYVYRIEVLEFDKVISLYGDITVVR